mmetsp:Transcript_40371/g.127038  ORF Transcript_40371/g.127038 Transcript_40371/m.127038 type:complete len:239 (-) Transcript_40371:1770-2486(-)
MPDPLLILAFIAIFMVVDAALAVPSIFTMSLYRLCVLLRLPREGVVPALSSSRAIPVSLLLLAFIAILAVSDLPSRAGAIVSRYLLVLLTGTSRVSGAAAGEDLGAERDSSCLMRIMEGRRDLLLLSIRQREREERAERGREECERAAASGFASLSLSALTNLLAKSLNLLPLYVLCSLLLSLYACGRRHMLEVEDSSSINLFLLEPLPSFLPPSRSRLLDALHTASSMMLGSLLLVS